MTSITTKSPSIADVRTEVTIAASAKETWEALTTRIGDWWPAEFYCGGGQGQPRMILEAKPGGRMAEEWDDGDGLLWGTVVAVQKYKSLQASAVIGPSFGGPHTIFVEFAIEATDKGCVVRHRETAHGFIAEGNVAEKEKGWSFLLQTLKAHLEGVAAPQWQD